MKTADEKMMIRDPSALAMIATIVRMLPRGRGVFARFFGRIMANYFRECYVTTKYGAKLAIAPSSLDFFVTMKNWGGSWEHWVYDSCKWVMPKKGIFYDIGANVGYMTIELMHEVTKATSVAFEPQETLTSALAKSVMLNGFQSRVQIIGCALSDHNGTAFLSLYAHDGHASLSCQGQEKGQVEVHTMTLDEAVKKNSLPHPDLIKIDVEGHEAAILRGGLETLRKSKPNVVFECSSEEQLHNIVEELLSIGDYQLFHAIGSYRPIKRFELDETILDKVDILAIETSRMAMLPSAFRKLS